MFYKKWILIIITIIFILNVGNFLDVTDNPRNVDIIVSLGGGTQKRLEKSVELFQLGYSKTGKLIYTGPTSYRTKRKNYTVLKKKDFFNKHGISNEHLVHIKAGNTYREVRHVGEYMLRNHLHSVLFVTDPPHSRRVKFLANSICDYDENNLSVYVAGTDPEWWDKNRFFLHKNAIIFVTSELLKFPYNYLAFGILKKYGLYDFVKENFGKTIHKIKDHINLFIGKEWK